MLRRYRFSGVASLCLAGLAFDWFEERLEAQTLLDARAWCSRDAAASASAVGAFHLLSSSRPHRSSVFGAHVPYLWGVKLWRLGGACRVYLTGGFRKPRELTWISGAFLALFTLAFGVSGYSLPWDQVGFWALQIVSALPETVDDFAPGAGIGTVVAIRGGFSVGQETLSRTCTAHTLALPAGDAAASFNAWTLGDSDS